MLINAPKVSKSTHTNTHIIYIEISLGGILGKGGFCTVSEVQKIILANGSEQASQMADIDNTSHIIMDRNYMARNYIRKGRDTRYAIKTLSSSLMRDPERFVAGVIDLVIETKFLSIIRHPVRICSPA